MCGLAGVAGNGLVFSDVTMFKELLYVASLRGRDSTGLVVANTNRTNADHYGIFKSEMASPEWIDAMTYKGSPLSVHGQNLMMGHCRWGTVGDKSIDNAHPFEFSQLIGMHNGTLEDLKYLYGKGTDSEMMFEDMNNRGIKAVLEGLDWRSAFAITVYCKKTRRLYMARNAMRSLCVGFDKRNGVMFWSSEAFMLHLVASRNKTDLDVYYLKPDTLYEIDINDIKPNVTNPWSIVDLKMDKWEPLDMSGYGVHGVTKKKHTVKLKDGTSKSITTINPDHLNDDIPWNMDIM